ncbi:hypothetical protein Tco_1405414 [Tanacetum coccineum]
MSLLFASIIVDAEWIEDFMTVKNEFLAHFRDRFDTPCKYRLTLYMNFPNKLSTDQMYNLERPFSKEETKGAVWDCGLNKSPGPDGFTFGFLMCCLYPIGWSFMLSSWIQHMEEGGYAILEIVNTRFLVKTWRSYAVSLFLDMAYWSEMFVISFVSYAWQGYTSPPLELRRNKSKGTLVFHTRFIFSLCLYPLASSMFQEVALYHYALPLLSSKKSKSSMSIPCSILIIVEYSLGVSIWLLSTDNVPASLLYDRL